MPVPTGFHSGEILAQQARGFEDDVRDAWTMYKEGAPSFMIAFLEALPLLSVTTLDDQGRPWGSILCNDGRAGFIRLKGSEEGSRFQCIIQAPVGVPIRECLLRLHKRLEEGAKVYNGEDILDAHFQLAGVGVMLHNRRRNKLEGVIIAVDEVPLSDEESKFVFQLEVSSTFGNCPKYINGRILMPVSEVNIMPNFSRGDGARLPDEVLSIIAAADTVFLATKHAGEPQAYPADPSHLGNNIRGGPSGFLRTYWDAEANGTCIVLPDWSGNRIMMSFGNMMSDPVAGIVIPIWSSEISNAGDVLHLTCKAQVLANEEASNLIRGVKGAVKLWPQSWSLARSCLPLYAADATNTPEIRQLDFPPVAWSPYNPPVRFLNVEKPTLASNTRPVATLIDTHFFTPSLATFTLELDAPLKYTPGQHIIMDCYDLLDTRVQLYSHMAQFRGGEKDLNDDGTRSWTVSYGDQNQSNAINRFQLTLRRKDRGGVTPGLFRRGYCLSQAIKERDTEYLERKLQIPILGIDGNCTLPIPSRPTTELRVSYIVSGIGLTPMLPHLSQLVQDGSRPAQVLAIMAVKWDEVLATKKMIANALEKGQAATPNLRIFAYLLAGKAPNDAIDAVDSESHDLPNMPDNVNIDWNIVRGQRLLSGSLMISKGHDEGFTLPDESLQLLQRSHQVVICAGDKFARTAREACNEAGIEDRLIKVESFSF